MAPIQYWSIVQLGIDLLLVVLILVLLRNIRNWLRADAVRQTSDQVLEMIEPLLKEADATAKAFENQLKEKNRLINSLNEKLDSRIISLNLLLNRAQAGRLYPDNAGSGQRHVYDQQEAIIDLYNKGLDAAAIADKLSMPRGEVDLVVDLKTKFSNL